MKKVYDLCCGAGGLSLGFRQAGAHILGGVDSSPSAVETVSFNHRRGSWKNQDIADLVQHLRADKKRIHPIFKATVLLAGLPCQGFSMAGKRDPDDERNSLFNHLHQIVSIVKPEAVVFENVQGLVHAKNELIFERIVKGFRGRGYSVHHKVLNSADYGVPQSRKRVILIAIKNHPAKEVFELIKKKATKTTVRDAFLGLPLDAENESINHTFMQHGKKVKKKLLALEHRVHLSYRRLKWDEQACTVIVGHNALPVHPDQPRAISVREAARLQGFPDSHIFKGSRTAQSVQVANAVPPPFARAVAKAVMKALDTL